MTHQEVRMLNARTRDFASYLVEEKIKNGKVNYAAAKNLKILSKEEELIQKGASPELKEIETKVITEGQKLMTEGDDFEKMFSLGYDTLSQEEKDKHKELMEAFQLFLSQESDVQLYKIKEEDIKECAISLPWMMFVEEFFV